MSKSAAERSGYLKSREGVRGAFSTEIDALFAAYDREGHPGLNLSVIKDGETIHRRGYGVANIEHDIPFTANTVLRLGSTSKHMCAATILLLQQAKLLSVEDDVRKHVPEMPDLSVRLTLDHLMRMSSGLPDWLNLPIFSGQREGGMPVRADILNWLRRLDRLMFEPGTSTSYSNTNYALLSLVIERLTGESIGAAMRRLLFEPLGLTSTRLVPFMSETVPDMARGYLPGSDGKPVQGLMMAEISGDGAINSTLTDMTRWFLAYRGRKALGLDLRSGLEDETRLSGGQIADYRRGMVVSQSHGVTRVGHAGGMPGYLCEFAFYPEIDVGVIMLINWMDGTLFDKVDEIAEIVSKRKIRPSDVTKNSEPDPSYEEALGLYISPETGRALSLQSSDGIRQLFVLGEISVLVKDGNGTYRAAKRGSGRVLEIVSRDAVELHEGAICDRFVRCADRPLTVEAPQRYVGSYVSRLLGERHSVEWDGSNLRVSTGSVLRPLVWSRLARRLGDVFTAPIDSEPSETNVTLKFLSNARGEIAGFECSLNRVHRLLFEREGT
jgi:CubicO group peptidase (beta-lactamase class C family)